MCWVKTGRKRKSVFITNMFTSVCFIFFLFLFFFFFILLCFVAVCGHICHWLNNIHNVHFIRTVGEWPNKRPCQAKRCSWLPLSVPTSHVKWSFTLPKDTKYQLVVLPIRHWTTIWLFSCLLHLFVLGTVEIAGTHYNYTTTHILSLNPKTKTMYSII